MICVRQGLRKYKCKKKYKEKYKNNPQTYDILFFWEGDDNRSLIMKNVENMQNRQNMHKMHKTHKMHNMLNLQSL